jgi:DNA-binding transcriptional regulator LsrR (DeoR family)
MASHNARSKRKLLTPDVIADIAMFRFRGLKKDGRLTSMAEVQDAFPARDRAVLSRAIEKAVTSGLVEIKAVKNTLIEIRRAVASRPGTDDVLEKALLDRFPKLEHVVVIKSPPLVDRSLADRSLKDAVTLRDTVTHANLGAAMARFIATNSVVQRNNVVGVGSGRGVDLTINSLAYFGKLRAQNVTLMSLTGSVYSIPKTKALWLDADRHVIELAKFFEEEPKQYLISHPLAHATPSELKKAQQRVWLGRPSVSDAASAKTKDQKDAVPQLTHLLVGAATFAHDHRFYVEASTSEREKQEPFLKPIHQDLVHLKRLCENAIASLPKGAAPEYSPAAEMSNFFFYVPPPPNFAIPNESQIRNCIERINSKCLSITEERIIKTQMLVVAGTERKSYTINALLNAYPVAYLCTDSDAASKVLEWSSPRKA